MFASRRVSTHKFHTLTLFLAVLLLAAALPGCGRGGPLPDGLYMRTHLSSAMFMWTELLYVSGDRICWDAKGGADPFDFDAAEKADPKKVGHYKINGDQIEIAWDGGGGVAKWHVEYEHGKVSAINAGGIQKADPYPKNTRLDASYEGNIGPNHESTGVPKQATLSFTKGGQCNLFCSGTVMYGGKILKQDPDYNRPGTYELSGNTLTIHSADGKTEKHTVLPFNSALDPAHAKLGDERLIYDAASLPRVK